MGASNRGCTLAAGLRMAGGRQIVVGAIDSDGTDGPGGALLADGRGDPVPGRRRRDGWTADRARAAGVDLHAALRTHDTSPALGAWTAASMPPRAFR